MPVLALAACLVVNCFLPIGTRFTTIITGPRYAVWNRATAAYHSPTSELDGWTFMAGQRGGFYWLAFCLLPAVHVLRLC